LQAACSQGGDRKSGTCATVFAAKKPKPLSLRTRWLAMKTSALKIVGIGEVLWDLLPGGKQLGGAPANFAYMSNLLGDHGIVASRIGSDPLGREMAEAMQQLGLTTSYLQTDETHSTGTVGVKVDPTGQPEFTITPSVAWDFLDWTPLWEELAGQADVVCFGTLAQRSPNSRVTIRRFLQAVRTDTLRVFDVNLRQTFFSAEVLSESLKYSDVVKLNDLELPLVCNLRTPLGSNLPALPNECSKHPLSLGAGPLGQAGTGEITIESGMFLDFSTSSATAYRARAYAFAFASSTVAPYAKAPAISGISAIQRPSVSRSISNWNRKSRLLTLFCGLRSLIEFLGCAIERLIACYRGKAQWWKNIA